MALPDNKLLDKLIDKLIDEEEIIMPDIDPSPFQFTNSESTSSNEGDVSFDITSGNVSVCTTVGTDGYYIYQTLASSVTIPEWEATDSDTGETVTVKDLLDMREQLDVLKSVIKENPEMQKLYKNEQVIRKLTK